MDLFDSHRNLLWHAIERKKGFAMFRYPGEDPSVIVGHLKKELTTPELFCKEKCFVFSPFARADKAWVLVPEVFNDVSAEQERVFQEEDYPLLVSNKEATKEEYEKLVSECIHEIREGTFGKLVAARSKTWSLSDPVDPVTFFFRLAAGYPNAMVYVFYSDMTGMWIGATPEVLLKVEGNRVTTSALAGTLPVNSEKRWTAKEIEEQYIVEKYIESYFEKNHSFSISKSEAGELVAGNVRHLYTAFHISTQKEMTQELFSDILDFLNPTPAVNGLPKQEAIRFIRRNEGFDRRFYTGFVGTIGQGKAGLYVNLRCMELGYKQAILYAGAGIVADSVPEAEWNETEKKMETISELLKA